MEIALIAITTRITAQVGGFQDPCFQTKHARPIGWSRGKHTEGISKWVVAFIDWLDLLFGTTVSRTPSEA
jgi:hypothetical protein